MRTPKTGTSIPEAAAFLTAEWHPDNPFAPTDVSIGSELEALWRCSADPTHEWRGRVANRAKGAGCPRCSLTGRSRTEVELAFELSAVLGTGVEPVVLQLPDGAVECDVVDHLRRVVIEYDGGYFHRSRGKQDRTKTERLERQGWVVVRIRDDGLEPVTPYDVLFDGIVGYSVSVHEAVCRVLDRLSLQLGEVPGAAGYAAGGGAVARDQAGEYLRERTRRENAEWEEAFGALSLHVGQFGPESLPPDLVVGDVALGKWVRSQRTLWRRGRLFEDRVERLERLAGWSWQPREDSWHRWYLKLRELGLGKHGSVAEPGLRNWVIHQRQLHKRGALSEEKAAKLEALHDWSWDSNETAWEAHYVALLAFVDQNPDWRGVAPRPLLVEQLRIGAWVHNQRHMQRNGRLSAQRVERLEQVPGWRWATPRLRGGAYLEDG